MKAQTDDKTFDEKLQEIARRHQPPKEQDAVDPKAEYEKQMKKIREISEKADELEKRIKKLTGVES